MKISVTVKPQARKTKVERLPDGSYRVAVSAPAHEGRANEAVIEVLADFFDVPKSRVEIVSGASGRKKIVEIG